MRPEHSQINIIPYKNNTSCCLGVQNMQVFACWGWMLAICKTGLGTILKDQKVFLIFFGTPYMVCYRRSHITAAGQPLQLANKPTVATCASISSTSAPGLKNAAGAAHVHPSRQCVSASPLSPCRLLPRLPT